MVSGMTAVAGSVLVGYAAMGIPLEHLLAVRNNGDSIKLINCETDYA